MTGGRSGSRGVREDGNDSRDRHGEDGPGNCLQQIGGEDDPIELTDSDDDEVEIATTNKNDLQKKLLQHALFLF